MSKYDRVLWDMLQQHPDEIHFLNTVFNFLQRRTPCFNGPNAQRNYEILIDTLCHQKERYMEYTAAGKPMKEPEPMAEEQEKKPEVKKAEARQTETKAQEKTEIRKEQISEKSCEYLVPVEEGTVELPAPTEQASEFGRTENQGSGLQHPVNNGGRTERYVWTQSLKEVTADFFLPPGMTGKMLKVETTAETLKISKKTGEIILEGSFPEKIFPSETTWTVENDILVLSIVKEQVGEMSWWSRLLEGDQAIDVQKIEPENSNLADLSPDIRQTVEQMMYDQKQKAMGKPTMKEQKNQEILQKFMQSHPEMDFSQCNFG